MNKLEKVQAKVREPQPPNTNFVLAARVNNFGALWWTVQAHVEYDPLTATPQSATIGFGGTDNIENVQISRIDAADNS